MDDVASWRCVRPLVALVAAAALGTGCAEGVPTESGTLASSECAPGTSGCLSVDGSVDIPPGLGDGGDGGGNGNEPGADGAAGAVGTDVDAYDQSAGGADGALANDEDPPPRCGGLDADGDGTLDCDDACPHNTNLVEACQPGRMTLQIDGAQVPSALVGFPLLVRLSGNADLALHADLDGMDIYFEDAQGVELPTDIESFSNGSLVAWVRIDLTGDEQQFVMRYGGGDRRDAADGAGVWDEEFEGVYHLDGTDDATAHGRNGTDAGGTTAHAAGQLGAARDFDGNSEIVIGTGLLPGDDDYTVSFWGRVDYDSGDDPKWAVSSKANTSPYEGFAAGIDKPTGHPLTWNSGWKLFDTQTVPNLGWVFVVARVHAASADGYVEFSLDGGPFERLTFGNTEQQRNVAGSALVIGGEGPNTHENWLGQLDEVRVSSTLRSDAWLQVAHASQRQGATLVTAGDHEAL